MVTSCYNSQTLAMDFERWQKVVELYEAAGERNPAQRIAFLSEACGDDEELRREIESLLDQDVSRPGLLEDIATRAVLWDSASRLPSSIGRYKILSLVGEGGMGAVYEAEQDHPRRTVALKIVKPGLAIPEILRRFEQESQALGRLQHPGIAQVYEAGFAGGQPYFAMELIRGLPLLQYAEAQRMDAAQRLQLVVKLCDAVQHAHQRGIVHRDLKPANILVEEGGQPKVLDFGVARITDVDGQTTRRTNVGALIGTLAYMSPEQVSGNPEEIDARTDVYALGMVLYELLAGRPPYETGGNVPDAIRVIREQDPAPLGRTSREFRGDLEIITAKALEKDKRRRYGSASDLAADIRRFLLHEPIHARPASTIYQVRKFAARNKALAGGVLAVFLVLLAGVLVSAWEAARALRAERTTKAVSEFLENDVLAQAGPRVQAGPNTRPDPDLKVRTALDRAAARIPGKFNSQPEVEAGIRQIIGNAYRDLGLYTEAIPQMERALELRRRVLGEEHADTLISLQELGTLYERAGKAAVAE